MGRAEVFFGISSRSDADLSRNPLLEPRILYAHPLDTEDCPHKTGVSRSLRLCRMDGPAFRAGRWRASRCGRGKSSRSVADRDPTSLALAFDVGAGPEEERARIGYQLALPPSRHNDLNSFRVLAIDTHPLMLTDTAVRSANARPPPARNRDPRQMRAHV